MPIAAGINVAHEIFVKNNSPPRQPIAQLVRTEHDRCIETLAKRNAASSSAASCVSQRYSDIRNTVGKNPAKPADTSAASLSLNNRHAISPTNTTVPATKAAFSMRATTADAGV